MLKRLKDQLSQVADELPGALNNRLNGSSRDSDRSNFADLVDENGEIEGFLCPLCMTHFSSPEQLSQHFDTMHDEKSTFVNPNYETGTSGNERSENNLEELRIQLKEEKNYATKLKEELDRIQSVVAQATDVPTGEVPYLLQQIQVLEAGKSMVTQRMLEFEKESSQLKRAVDNAAKERTEIMGKLKQQSQQLRELTDEAENNKVEKEVLNRELVKNKTEMEKLNIEIDKLNKTLDQRPSEDDVAVLRTELVNAQKLMDEIAQQKDVEIQEHMHSIRQLNLEREKDNCIKQNLQKALETSGSSTAEKATRLSELESELLEKANLLQVSQKEMADGKDQISALESRATDLQSRLDSNVQELSLCREKISQLEETVKKSSHDIEDAATLNTKNQDKLLTVSQKLEQMVEEKRKQEMELLSGEEKQAQQSETIRGLEQSNADLTRELASANSHLKQERASLTQKSQELEEKTTFLKTLEAKVEEITAKCDRQTKDLEDGASVISLLREKITNLELNAQELVGKITEGEGGAKMAIDQLTSENKKFTDSIVDLEAQIQEQKQLRETEIESLNQKLREAKKVSADALSKYKKEHEELGKKLKEADDELKQNSARFEEMEKDTETERKKASERFEKLKEVVLQKDALAGTMRQHNEELIKDVEQKELMLREKERNLEDSRLKIEESVKRLEEAEAKARELENALRNSESLRETASSTEEDLREELIKAQQAVSNLKKEGSKLTATVTEKDHEIEAIKRDLAQKSQHWDSKKKEFEEQLIKNQDTNEELLSSLKETQEVLIVTKRESESRQKDLATEKSYSHEMSGKLTEFEAAIDAQLKKEQELTKKLEEATSEKQIVEKVKQDLEEEIVNLHEKVEEKEKVVEQLNVEKAELQEQKQALQISTESVQQAVERNESLIHEQLSEINKYKDENITLREKIAANEAELITRFEQLRKMEEEIASERSTQEKVASDLVKNNTEMAEKLRDLTDALEKVEIKLSEAISAKEEIEKSLGKNKEELETKGRTLMTLKESLVMEHEKFETMETNYSKQINELQEDLCKQKRTVQTLQSELDHKKQEFNDAQSTSTELAAKNIELQQEITSWNDEKNALIERCLRTESDLDFERDRALENKRRFDDSVAAMHELGRANQSLQMDISKHTTRKWLDDSAAVNCTSCGKIFTMTVRKHHCRVCGLIFCGQCTDKTAKIVSNKNPVRVCDSCFVEVQNR